MSIRKLLTSAAIFGVAAIAQSEAGVEDLDGPGTDLYDKDLSSCPGYVASNQHETRSGFYADLSLAGEACNVYGTDLPDLKLEVEYQTSERLHVKIKDSNNTVYQVPDEVFPRPGFGQWCSPKDSKLQFNFNADPFSFSVSRTDTGEVLFDTTGEKLVFESQYVYVKTHLPEEPHLYGLGEHSDSFMLNSTNYTRTIYTRDSYGTPQGENLYGECGIPTAALDAMLLDVTDYLHQAHTRFTLTTAGMQPTESFCSTRMEWTSTSITKVVSTSNTTSSEVSSTSTSSPDLLHAMSPLSMLRSLNSL
jgi:alpha-glucosidase (family GH31 glycosyl hydrolase)